MNENGLAYAFNRRRIDQWERKTQNSCANVFSFAVVSYHVLSVELASWQYSAIRARSVGYCALNMVHLHFFCDFIVQLKWRHINDLWLIVQLKWRHINDLWLIVQLKWRQNPCFMAQTSDSIICRSSRGMPHSAWQLTASAVSYQTKRSVPPEDGQIIMFDVCTSVIL